MGRYRQSRVMQRIGRMFANLGNLYGRLYGSGNSGGVLADDSGLRPASARRRIQKKQARKHRRHK